MAPLDPVCEPQSFATRQEDFLVSTGQNVKKYIDYESVNAYHRGDSCSSPEQEMGHGYAVSKFYFADFQVSVSRRLRAKSQE
jgi:hypothetical protein